MFKMGCSMARKILAPGSGGGSSTSGPQVSGPGDASDHLQHHNQPQHGKKDPSSNNRKQQQQQQQQQPAAGAGPAPKPKTGDELNDFSKLQEDPRLPLNVRQIFKITKSWKAIARTMSKTGTAMFLNLFEQNQDLFYLFERFQHLKGKQELHESMELREHAATVMSTLDQSINLLSDYDNFVTYLHSIGKLHRKVPGFQREHFWKIEQPFLKAIKQTLDERCNETIEEIYKIAIKLIIETIADGYGQDDQQQLQTAPSDGHGHGGGSSPDGGNGGQRNNNNNNNNTGANRDPSAPPSGGSAGQQAGSGGFLKSSSQAGAGSNPARSETVSACRRTMEAAGGTNQTLAGRTAAIIMDTEPGQQTRRKMDNWMLTSAVPSDRAAGLSPEQASIQVAPHDLDLCQRMNQLAPVASLNVGIASVLGATNRINGHHRGGAASDDATNVGDDDNKISADIVAAPSRADAQTALLIGSACNLINRMTKTIESSEVTLTENDGLADGRAFHLMRNTLLAALGGSARGTMDPQEDDEPRGAGAPANATTTTGPDNIGDSRLPSRENGLASCPMDKTGGGARGAVLFSAPAAFNEAIKSPERPCEPPDEPDCASKINSNNNNNNNKQQDFQMKIIKPMENLQQTDRYNVYDYLDDGKPDSGIKLHGYNGSNANRFHERNVSSNPQVNKQFQAKNIINDLSRNPEGGTCVAHSEGAPTLGPRMRQKPHHLGNTKQQAHPDEIENETSTNPEARLTLISAQQKHLRRPPICPGRASDGGEFHLMPESFYDKTEQPTSGIPTIHQATETGATISLNEKERQTDKVAVSSGHVGSSTLIDFRSGPASCPQAHNITFTNNGNTTLNNERTSVVAPKPPGTSEVDSGNLFSVHGLKRTASSEKSEQQTTASKGINPSSRNRTKMKLISSLNFKRRNRPNLDKRESIDFRPRLEPIEESIGSSANTSQQHQEDCLSNSGAPGKPCHDHVGRAQRKQTDRANTDRLATLSEAFEHSRRVADKLLASTTARTNLGDLSEFFKMLILINKLILSLASSRTSASERPAVVRLNPGIKT